MRHITECINAVKCSDRIKAKRQTERENGLLGPSRGYRKQNQAQQTRKTEQQEERTNTARRRGGRDTQTALHTITQPSLQRATHKKTTITIFQYKQNST